MGWPLVVAGLASAGASIYGAYKDYKLQKKNAEINRDTQKEFAQHGVSWRVADARKAGIHPDIALGANIPISNPVHVGSNFGKAYGLAGQDISRAISSFTTRTQKQNAELDLQIKNEQLRNMRLQNQSLSNDVNKPKSFVTDDAVILGQADSSYRIKPNEIVAARSHGIASGPASPVHTFVEDEYGRFLKVPTGNLQESLSEGPILTQVKYAATQLKEYVQGHLASIDPNSKYMQQFIKDLIKQRPLLDDKRYEARYDPNWGGFVRRKKNGVSKLFTVDSLNKRFHHFMNRIEKGRSLGMAKSHR